VQLRVVAVLLGWMERDRNGFEVDRSLMRAIVGMLNELRT
jgi:hypothetical protein